MKPLEIPYNFDKNLIEFLKYYKAPGGHDAYHCIYFPPFWEDYISAKYYYHVEGLTLDMNNNRSMNRDDYALHIKNIVSNLPDKAMLLLQQNDRLIDEKLLREFYIEKLHITRFCVGSIKQAKVLKSINKDFEIVGSIALKITPEMLNSNDYDDYFDAFVLPFTYNRSLNLVKTLPKKFKYIVLTNCGCSIYCVGSHHWFAKSIDDDANIKCPHIFNGFDSKNHKLTIQIQPWETMLWDNYVSCYKLQGREYRTSEIINDIILYTQDWHMIKNTIELQNESNFNTNINNYAKSIIADYCYGKISVNEAEEELSELVIDK